MAERETAEEDTRAKIVESAGPIFAAHGFDQTTVREICAAAGVNVASIGYYFGDKMGLYMEVVRRVRNDCAKQFPLSELSGRSKEERLHAYVLTMLQRMLSGDHSGWQSQLMMREMNRPTAAFREMVDDYMRPLLEQLKNLLREFVPGDIPPPRLDQLALSVVGQCLYYRVGRQVIQQLIDQESRDQHFDVNSLARHIVGVTISAASDGAFLRHTPEPLPRTEASS